MRYAKCAINDAACIFRGFLKVIDFFSRSKLICIESRHLQIHQGGRLIHSIFVSPTKSLQFVEHLLPPLFICSTTCVGKIMTCITKARIRS